MSIEEKRKDVVGKRFKGVTILSLFKKPNNKRIFCKYLCDCGKESQIRLSDIISNGKSSCGCMSGLPDGESSMRRVISDYKSNAQRKNREYSLSNDSVRKLLLSDCFYCSSPPGRKVDYKKLKGSIIVSGIDRLDNNKGYTEENCVSSCKRCNYKKGADSHDDFIQWIKSVYWNLPT